MEFAARLNVHDITFIPDLGAARRQRRAALREHVVVRRIAAAQPSRVGLHRQRRELHRPPFPGAVRHPQPDARRRPTSGATPGPWPAACSGPGDDVLVMPSGTTSRIASIQTADGEVAEAFPPMAVVITLTDDIAVSRGDILCRPNNRPTVSHDIEATVCWMDERSSLAEGRTYLLKHSTRTVRATARDAAVPARRERPAPRRGGVDARAERDRPRVVPLHRAAAGRRLHDQPDHGQLHRHRPDHQRHGRGGRDPGHRHHPRQPQRGAPRRAAVPGRPLRRAGARRARRSCSPACPGRASRRWPPGVEEAFVRSGRPAFLLDGDNLRHGLNGDLGFSDRDRTENVRRAGEVARMFAESGALALIALICPFEEDRRLIRTLHEEAGLAFAEVFVDTSLEECERRDPKGLYARARAGQLPGLHRHRLGVRDAPESRPGGRAGFGQPLRAGVLRARSRRGSSALVRWHRCLSRSHRCSHS